MTNIKKWAIDDRPREKLMLKGVNALSDAELLAIIISSGSREETAVGLARRILQSADNDLNKLGDFSVSELTKHKGIGPAKAISIVAATELGRRRKQIEITNKKLLYAKDVYNVFASVLSGTKQEEFWVIAVGNAKNYIDKKIIGVGGIDKVYVDIRIIMTFLLKSGATGFFICHNHLSGNLKPSRQDILLTGKINNAGSILEIELLDHLIISGENYFSFADNSLIN